VKLFFIRHAKAVDRINWLKDDMLRPLSDKGIASSRMIFKALSKVYEAPDLVISSEATRAGETAESFIKYFPSSKIQKSSMLNPGASCESVRNLISQNSSCDSIALIGHEPDFGHIISELISTGGCDIDFKKCGLIEVEVDKNFKGVLKSFIPPKVFG
jgi:phosphohistidine phosphatase